MTVEKPPKVNMRRGRPSKRGSGQNATTSAGLSITRTSTVVGTQTKERALVRSGYGIRIFEEIENIYIRMPHDKRVNVIHSAKGVAKASSTYGKASSLSTAPPNYARHKTSSQPTQSTTRDRRIATTNSEYYKR
ncbi:conserved hypothetical protein [Ricinus communis]|uniref:Uncharacterized protein n=1 Tax=Ricinus communis TaxID=3988 RepID=B9SJC4_RICCO|nr:conserved hypothetical protein [Ricinus communis]